MKSEYLSRPIYSAIILILLFGGPSKAFDIEQPNNANSTSPMAIAGDERLPATLQLEHMSSKSLDAVPMEMLEKVADIHAKAIWGSGVARGAPLQIVDIKDEPILYAFPFAIGEHSIPSTDELLKQFSEKQWVDDKSGWEMRKMSLELASDIKTSIGHYGTIYVSARKRDYPVRRVSHALHPYFYNASQAQMSAAFDSPVLTKLRYIPPYEFFEIQSGDSTIRLHTHTLMSESEILKTEDRYTRNPITKAVSTMPAQSDSEEIAAAWEAYENSSQTATSYFPRPTPYEFKIRDWRRIAVIDWTRWCEPTAVSMAFSYWDHYVPEPGVGGYPNYPRLVDYWFDHPSNGHNVPDIIDPIADGINIDVANVLKGYNWTVEKVLGTSNNDYAWNELTGHLHINHPVVWQVHGSIHHAVTAFGYRIVNGQKYVALYNTWSDDPAIAYDEWLYNDWTSVEVDRYRPGGKELYRNVIVRRPYGGETFNIGEWNKILFHLHPITDVKLVRIESSIDGGRNWSLVVEMVVQPGWNTWWWKPKYSSSRARIRIKGMARDRTYLGGDGSYNNFTIQ